MKDILLVNPWIYDFAAYDLWMKPWGLLKISAILQKNGFNVHLVDALDRHHPLLKKVKKKDLPNGTGKYLTRGAVKPEVLRGIPREYKRYGMQDDIFRDALPEKTPDIILVSSGMTYWYPAVREVIGLLRREYGGVPIVLGGTYATLSYEHALANSGADHVIGNKELDKLSALFGGECDLSFRNILDSDIDYVWYRDTPYGVLRISLGCPFKCSYCAQHMLSPGHMLKDRSGAMRELGMLYRMGKRIYAFYDDALLFDTGYIEWYLESVSKKYEDLAFYTPNGLHARYISNKIAVLMKKAGFKKPVLSLETADDNIGRTWHSKVTKEDLAKAVSSLREAGFGEGDYMVYLMFGGEGNTLERIRESMDFVHSLGAWVSLSEYSPIPGTFMSRGYALSSGDPLLQNNSIFPGASQYTLKEIQAVKDKARQLNLLLR